MLNVETNNSKLFLLDTLVIEFVRFIRWLSNSCARYACYRIRALDTLVIEFVCLIRLQYACYRISNLSAYTFVIKALYLNICY